MKKLTNLTIVILSLCFFGGCINTTEPERLLWPEETELFTKVSKDWYRKGSIYEGFEPLLHMGATMKSLAWRRSYAVKYSEEYGLTQSEYQTFFMEQLNEQEESLTFVISLSSPDIEYSNLEFNDPLWKVFIISQGKKLYPLEIRELDWPAQKLKTFFPFYKPWQKFYEIKFPPQESAPVTLTLSGPGGRIDCRWEKL